jgi:hypothetical protein
LFHNSQLRASSFDDFFAVLDKARSQLPVVTSEIGDTWIHGISSDPYKTAAMRVLMRAHARAVSSSASSSPPPSLPDGFAEFERLLLKCPEHTWGGDQKTFLHYGKGGDYFNWSNAQFQAAAADGEFDVRNLHPSCSWSFREVMLLTQVLIATYEEQRAWCPAGAVAALPASSSFRLEIEAELSLLHPLPPSPTPPSPLPPLTPITIANFTLTFDSAGALVSMTNPCGQQLGQARRARDERAAASPL